MEAKTGSPIGSEREQAASAKLADATKNVAGKLDAEKTATEGVATANKAVADNKNAVVDANRRIQDIETAAMESAAIAAEKSTASPTADCR